MLTTPALITASLTSIGSARTAWLILSPVVPLLVWIVLKSAALPIRLVAVVDTKPLVKPFIVLRSAATAVVSLTLIASFPRVVLVLPVYRILISAASPVTVPTEPKFGATVVNALTAFKSAAEAVISLTVRVKALVLPLRGVIVFRLLIDV